MTRSANEMGAKSGTERTSPGPRRLSKDDAVLPVLLLERFDSCIELWVGLAALEEGGELVDVDVGHLEGGGWGEEGESGKKDRIVSDLLAS